MKKVITILMILVFAVSMALIVSAEEAENSIKISATGGQETENGKQETEDRKELTSPVGKEGPYTLSPDPLKEYVEEKIVPVLMGVITSVVALLSTLKGIFSSLKGLKESKENFDKDRESIKEESKKELAKITEKYEEIKNEVKTICLLTTEIEKLKGQATVLSKEIANLSEIASLGFSKNQELVKEGNARKIVVLAEKNKEISDSETI